MSSYKLKILLVAGYGAVAGKTCFVIRFMKNRFHANPKLTVGIDIHTKDIDLTTGELATLSLWDISDNKRFDFIRSTFYKGAAGVMLFFDITRSHTFDQIPNQLAEVREYTSEGIPFVLIGNKADMLEEVGEIINRDEIRAYAEKEGGIYIEASAKTGLNVQYAFEEITRRVVSSRIKERKETQIEKSETKEKKVELEKQILEIEKLIENQDVPRSIKALSKFIEEAEKYNLDNLIDKGIEMLNLSIKGRITQKGILAFISYSSKDSKVFEVKKVAELLTSYKEIADVWYFEEDTKEDFVEYMNKYIADCDLMILFCSESAIKSRHVNAEWRAAFALEKPIVPVFEEINYIPPLLRSKVGIEFDRSDFQKNIKNLYDRIMKNQ